MIHDLRTAVLRYQYLRTLEAMLDALEDESVAAVRIEGPHGAEQVNAVDFDMVAGDGRVLLAAQVKSIAPGGTVSAATAFGQLLQLICEHDAENYQLLTNAIPEPSAQQLADVLASAAPADELRTAVSGTLNGHHLGTFFGHREDLGRHELSGQGIY